MPFPVFRARGGRGPQVGPGTFDGRSAPVPSDALGAPKPPFAEAFVWAAGPGTPSVELWCYHKDFFVPLQGFDSTQPTVFPQTSLFLDKVSPDEEFVPPNGASPDSLEACEAFRDFARYRYYSAFPRVTAPEDWSVQVQVPSPSPAAANPRKMPEGFYRVAQVDRSTQATQLAWVSVTDNGSREIWLFYRPDEIDGFHFAGDQPAGDASIYESTQMMFTAIAPPTSPAGYPWNSSSFSLGQRLNNLKGAAKDDPGSPVSDVNQLVVHDLYVNELILP